MEYSTSAFFIDFSVVLVAVLLLFFLFSKRIRKSDVWNATVTPLASIIGSGFLIVAPLLWMLAGYMATWVLLGVVVIAYAVGSVVRYNIRYVEPYINTKENNRGFKLLSHIAYISLGVSYFVSIAFYIRVLSSFALKFVFIEDVIVAKLLTSAILLVIGVVGYMRGFDRLELWELFSVNLKLCIIVILLLSLFIFDWSVLNFEFMTNTKETEFTFTSIRKICGILLIIQGFEISRYIGHKYNPELRIKTMRLAQLISSAIYIVFIFLILFLMGIEEKVTETAIIDLTRKVSFLLPVIVTVGAMFSQFSAAIADTVGCGGIVEEYSSKKISHNTAYLVITLSSIALIWIANVFEIITLASQTFAAFYLTQCIEALYANYYYKHKGKLWSVYFLGIGLLMLFVLIFGIPVE